MWEYRARLEEVIDGDTVRLLVDTGFYARHRVDIRLVGVMAPEMNELGGPETKAFVEQWMAGLADLEWPILVRTQVTKTIEPTEKQTFTRYIGEALNITSDASLNYAVTQFVAEEVWHGN